MYHQWSFYDQRQGLGDDPERTNLLLLHHPLLLLWEHEKKKSVEIHLSIYCTWKGGRAGPRAYLYLLTSTFLVRYESGIRYCDCMSSGVTPGISIASYLSHGSTCYVWRPRKKRRRHHMWVNGMDWWMHASRSGLIIPDNEVSSWSSLAAAWSNPSFSSTNPPYG